MAQRILVQRGDRSAVLALRAIVRRLEAPAALHAIAALDALSSLDGDDLRTALKSQDPGLLAFALRHAAALLSSGDEVAWARCDQLAGSAPQCVRLQLACALGDVRGHGEELAMQLLAKLGAGVAGDSMLVALVSASARGREPDFARRILASGLPAAGSLLQAIAQQAAAGREPSVQVRMLEIASAVADASLQERLLAGFCAAIPADARSAAGMFRFAETPAALAEMSRSDRPAVVAHAQRILGSIVLSSGAAPVAETMDDSLTDVQKARVEAGSKVYMASCAICHQPQGQGLGGLAPPIAGSEWATGDPERLVLVALHGVRGRLRAAEVEFDGEMPPQSHISDADLAAALTYVRRAFGHHSSCIEPEQVKALRERHAGRASPWPAAELQGK